MNKNYLLSILKDYFNEIKNKDYNSEELSIIIENIIIDLKDLDRNIN
jgi:hypothetical protein